MKTTPGWRAILSGVFWDVGPSLVAYFVATWAGAGPYVALLAGSLAAVVRMVWVAVRARRLDFLAAVMFGVFTVGLGLSFLTGSPTFLLVKDSFGTSVAGLAFLVSCFVGRPLIYHAGLRLQEGNPAGVAEFEQKWRDLPRFRRNLRIMSAVWGGGLLFDAIARIPLVLALSTPAAVAASTALFVAVTVLLALWNVRFVKSIEAREAAWEAEAARAA